VNVCNGGETHLDRKYDSLEGGELWAGDLQLINEIRRRICLLLYRGDGVLLGARSKLGTLVGAEIQSLANQIVDRGQKELDKLHAYRQKSYRSSSLASLKGWNVEAHWAKFRTKEHPKTWKEQDHIDATEECEREQAGLVFGGFGHNVGGGLGGTEDWAQGMMTINPSRSPNHGGFTFKKDIESIEAHHPHLTIQSYEENVGNSINPTTTTSFSFTVDMTKLNAPSILPNKSSTSTFHETPDADLAQSGVIEMDEFELETRAHAVKLLPALVWPIWDPPSYNEYDIEEDSSESDDDDYDYDDEIVYGMAY
jgi:hypothetical protein